MVIPDDEEIILYLAEGKIVYPMYSCGPLRFISAVAVGPVHL